MLGRFRVFVPEHILETCKLHFLESQSIAVGRASGKQSQGKVCRLFTHNLVLHLPQGVQ
jgi:hypothetical protein